MNNKLDKFYWWKVRKSCKKHEKKRIMRKSDRQNCSCCSSVVPFTVCSLLKKFNKPIISAPYIFEYFWNSLISMLLKKLIQLQGPILEEDRNSNRRIKETELLKQDLVINILTTKVQYTSRNQISYLKIPVQFLNRRMTWSQRVNIPFFHWE